MLWTLGHKSIALSGSVWWKEEFNSLNEYCVLHQTSLLKTSLDYDEAYLPPAKTGK